MWCICMPYNPILELSTFFSNFKTLDCTRLLSNMPSISASSISTLERLSYSWNMSVGSLRLKFLDTTLYLYALFILLQLQMPTLRNDSGLLSWSIHTPSPLHKMNAMNSAINYGQRSSYSNSALKRKRKPST